MEGAPLGHVGRGETGGSWWSTLQGLPGLPGALGLSLQMFLLCLQLLCQLLGLKEAALQHIPLGPVENHQTAGQSPSDPICSWPNSTSQGEVGKSERKQRAFPSSYISKNKWTSHKKTISGGLKAKCKNKTTNVLRTIEVVEKKYRRVLYNLLKQDTKTGR